MRLAPLAPRNADLHRASLALSLLLATGCTARHFVPPRPERSLDRPGITRFHYASSSVQRFSDPHGKPCKPVEKIVRDHLFGWPAQEDDAPTCWHDSLDHGPEAGTLELRWVARIPADGDYAVAQGMFGLTALVAATVRSGQFGDFSAAAVLAVDAVAPSCRASWTTPLARVDASAGWHRGREFAGAVEVAELALQGCRAGEEVALRVRLVGQATRGRVEVGWVGFSAYAPEDVDQLFGLRPGPAEQPPAVEEKVDPLRLPPGRSKRMGPVPTN